MALGLTQKSSIGPSNLSRGLLVAGGPRSGTKWTISGTDSAAETARAVYGASDEEFAAAVEYELALEQSRRPDVFVKKWPSRRVPGSYNFREAKANSDLVTLKDFASLYAAVEFSGAFGMPLDTTVTIAWSLLGYRQPDEVQREFTAFQKCLTDWLAQRVLPVSYIYSHESGPARDLHTHLAVFIPGCRAGFAAVPRGAPEDLRTAFRLWVMGYAERHLGRRVPRSFRVRTRHFETPWLQWLNFAYFVKGCDRSEVVVSARNRPDRSDIRLGDLIPVCWRDPGKVELKSRVGWTRSIGAGYRAIGAPPSSAHELPRAGVSPDFSVDGTSSVRQYETWARPAHTSPKPFRSKYEDGIRDVRQLYPPEIWEYIIGPQPKPDANRSV